MHPSHALVLLLVVLLNADAGVSFDCDQPTPVLKFAAAFAASLDVTLPPGAVNGSTGYDAAVSCFDVVMEILGKKLKTCSADHIAITGARAFALYDYITPKTYFDVSGITVGEYLYKKGLLSCDNAVALALEFSAFVRADFAKLDLSKFASLIYGLVDGIANFYIHIGLSLEDDYAGLADDFYVVLDEDTKMKSYPMPDHCPASR